MMRIRTVKPEFWRSDDIAALDREDRLLFVGIWSYVDDNGVGRDSAALIAADIYPHDMERDPRDTLARIHRGLETLAAAGLITRYEAREEGKEQSAPRKWLSVVNWHHQKIDRPNKSRYPGPDQAIDESSRDSREDVAKPRETVAPVVSIRGSEDQVSKEPLLSEEVGAQAAPAPNPPAKTKRATTLPKSWKPNAGHADYATNHRLALDVEVEKFRDHHAHKGTLGKDWDAGFRTWLRNSATWRDQQQAKTAVKADPNDWMNR